MAQLLAIYFDLGSLVTDLRYRAWTIDGRKAVLGYELDKHEPAVTELGRLVFGCIGLSNDWTSLKEVRVDIDLRTFEATITPATPDLPRSQHEVDYYLKGWADVSA